jgi:hypothetical protein
MTTPLTPLIILQVSQVPNQYFLALARRVLKLLSLIHGCFVLFIYGHLRTFKSFQFTPQDEVAESCLDVQILLLQMARPMALANGPLSPVTTNPSHRRSLKRSPNPRRSMQTTTTPNRIPKPMLQIPMGLSNLKQPPRP